MNTCLQILAHTFELNDIVLQPAPPYAAKKNPNETTLLSEWCDLILLMWQKPVNKREDIVVVPRKFLYFLHKVAKYKGKELFADYSQNDFTEFMLFFIDMIHEAIGRPVDMVIRGELKNSTDIYAQTCYEMLQKDYAKKYSEIYSLFYGVLISELRRKDGGESKPLSIKAEPFFTLDLPVAKHLYEAMDIFTTGELLCGDNAWFNEATGRKEDVTKNIMFWNFPPVLVMTLKRFDYRGRKNESFVTYPVTELDLSKYCIGYGKKDCVYNLYGVACHIGNMRGGHYYAYVMNRKTGVWYCYNDEKCSVVKDVREVVTADAYSLYWNRAGSSKTSA